MKTAYKIFIVLTINLLINSLSVSAQENTDTRSNCETNKSAVKIDLQEKQTYDLSEMSSGSLVCIYSSKPISVPVTFEFVGDVKAFNSSIVFQKSVQLLDVKSLNVNGPSGFSLEVNGGVNIESLNFTNTQYSSLKVNDGADFKINSFTSESSNGNYFNIYSGKVTFLKGADLNAFSNTSLSDGKLVSNGTLKLGEELIQEQLFNLNLNDGSVLESTDIVVYNSSLTFNSSQVLISGGDLKFADNNSSMTLTSTSLTVKGNLQKETNLNINLNEYSHIKVAGILASSENIKNVTFNSSIEVGCAIVEATNSNLNEVFSYNPNVYYYGFKPKNPGSSLAAKDPTGCSAPAKFISQSFSNVNVGDTLLVKGLFFPKTPSEISIAAVGLYDEGGKPLYLDVIEVVNDRLIKIIAPNFGYYLTLELNNTQVYLNANSTFVDSLGIYNEAKPFWLYGQNLMGVNEVWLREDVDQSYSYRRIEQIIDNTHRDSVLVYSSQALDCNLQIGVARSTSQEFDAEYEITSWIGGFGAEEINVTPKNTIEEIIEAACSYSTIIFDEGVYSFNSVLLNRSKNNLTFIGKKGATVIFEDENSYDLTKSGFVLENAGKITFKNIQIRNSQNEEFNNSARPMARTLANVPSGVGGAILVTNGTDLVLEDMVFENNYAGTAGGAIAVYNEGGQSSLPMPSLTIKGNVDFNNNIAGYIGGGAIYIHNDAKININDAQFVKNFTDAGASGGAIYYYMDQVSMSTNGKSIAYLDKSVFKDNGVIGSTEGGAIALNSTNYAEVEFRISNTQFINNKASNGGAILDIGFALQLDSNNFETNEAYRGGAINFSNQYMGVSKINSCAFLTNKAIEGSGGAIYAGGLVPNVTKSTFYKNSTIGGGGAVYYTSPTVYDDILFDKNLFEENTSGGNGGSIYLEDMQSFYFNSFVISNSSLINNNSGGNGGAIYSSLSNNIEYSSIIGNSSKGDGGALYLAYNGSGTNTLTHLTIARNSAESGETGGLYSGSYSNNVENCAIGENALTGDLTKPQYFSYSQVYFSGKNIITTASEVTTVGFLGVTHLDQLYLEPQLTVLGNQKYLKPYSFSPLVDQISEAITNGQTIPSKAIDQIGNPISGKLLDVGAIEYVDGINPLNVTLTEDALKNGSIRGSEIYVNYHYGNNDITFENTLAGIELRDALVFSSNLLPVDSTKMLTILGSTTKNLIGRSNEVTKGFNFIETNYTANIQNLVVNGILGATKNDGTGVVIRDDATKSIVKNLIIKNNKTGITSKADSVQILNCTIYSNSESGILLSENSDAVGEIVQGNIIGLDENYKVPAAAEGENHSLVGLAALHSNALIGGNKVSEGNVIGGNNNIGLAIGASNIRVLNNLIGITPSNAKVPNNIGIDFVGFTDTYTSYNIIGEKDSKNIIANNQIGINMPSTYSEAGSYIYQNSWYNNQFSGNDTATKIENNYYYQSGLQSAQELTESDSIISGFAGYSSRVYVYLDSTDNATFLVDSVGCDNNGYFTLDLKGRKLPKYKNFSVIVSEYGNSSPLSQARPLGCAAYKDSLGLDSNYVFCLAKDGTGDGEISLKNDLIESVYWFGFDGEIWSELTSENTLTILQSSDNNEFYAQVELSNGCSIKTDTLQVRFENHETVTLRDDFTTLTCYESAVADPAISFVFNGGNDFIVDYFWMGNSISDTLSTLKDSIKFPGLLDEAQELVFDSIHTEYCPASIVYDTIRLDIYPTLSKLIADESCDTIIDFSKAYSVVGADSIKYFMYDAGISIELTDSLFILEEYNTSTFNVEAQSVYGCVSSDEFSSQRSSFYISVDADSVIVCDEADLDLGEYLSYDGGTINWMSNVFTFDEASFLGATIIDGFGSENVKLEIINGMGCTRKDSIFIRRTAPFTLKDTTFYDCGEGLVLSENLSGNRPNLAYNFMQTSLKLGDTIKYEGVVGNYGLYVEDTVTTCNSYSSFNLNDGSISVTSTFTNPICFGYEDGTIALVIKNQGGEIPLVNWISANVGGQKGTSISNLDAGKYEVEASANGCADTSSIVLTSPPALAYTKTQNIVQFCSGGISNVNVINTVNSTYSFNWTAAPIGLNISTPTLMNPIVTSSIPGAYYAFVNIVDFNGCVAKDSIQFIVNQLPTVNAGNDINICIGDTATLSQSGAFTYSWGQTQLLPNLRIAPKGTTTYTLTGVDNFGCSNTDEVKVIVNALPIISAGLDTSICKGDSIILSSTGGVSYAWSPTLSSTSNVSPLQTQKYYVVGEDVNGCKNTDSIIVKVNGLKLGESITVNDTVSTNEDENLKFNINSKFINLNQLIFNYSIIKSSTNVSATLQKDTLNLNYKTNFNGKDTLRYRVTDLECKVDTGYVFVTINPVNDALVKINPTITTLELSNVSQTISTENVLTNILNIDEDALTISNIQSALNALVSFNPLDSIITYTSPSDLPLGTITIDTITYDICDNQTPQLCISDTIFVNIDISSKLNVSLTEVPKAICLGDELSLDALVLNKTLNTTYEWSYFNNQDDNIDTDSNLTTTPSEAGIFEVTLKVSDPNMPDFDTTFSISVNSPVALKDFNLQLSSYINGITTDTLFKSKMELFSCSAITHILLDQDKIITWDNDDLSSFGNYPFTITDLDKVCSIRDSISIKINDKKDTISLGLTVDYGLNTITQKPIILPNFGNVKSATIVSQSKLGTSSILFVKDKFELNFISATTLAKNDSVQVRFYDVCNDSVTVTLQLDLQNSKPSQIDTTKTVTFKIDGKQDLNLPIKLLAIDPNKNQKIINVFNKEQFPYLEFITEYEYSPDYDDTIAVGLLLKVRKTALSKDILLGVKDTIINVYYEVCDSFGCSDSLLMILRFEFDTPPSVIDLSPFTKKQIKNRLEVVIINNAVSNEKSLSFDYMWGDTEIPDLENIGYELTIMSRWGDVVYHDKGFGKSMEWYGEYRPNSGSIDDTKVEDGNYFFVLTVQYEDKEGNIGNEHKSGYLYFINRDID